MVLYRFLLHFVLYHCYTNCFVFRGRLNVLANVARKPLDTIFCQFNQMEPEDEVNTERRERERQIWS